MIKLRLLQRYLISFCCVLPGYALAESNEDFQRWVQKFKPQAIQAGISESTFNLAFANVKLNERVLELDRRQPEFTRTFWQYIDMTVTPLRIERGRLLRQQHAPLLTQVTERYGVDDAYLLSFWAMETNFGSFTGNTPTIEALATLAYDPRRSAFFTEQLLYALRILEEGHLTLEQMKGSWAGALGHTQFMPSNYIHYTVDGDGSGRKDLFNSLDDVFHSAGHFLNRLGWRAGQDWGYEVRLPKGFDYALADGRTQRSIGDWAAMGITTAQGERLNQQTDPDTTAALLLPSDYRGPAFLVFHNFNVIKRWNNSNNYALAVGLIADQIRHQPGLVAKAPADDAAMSRDEVIALQNHLNRLGFDVGRADGIAGQRTRQGLREFQVKQGMPADGFPSPRMLKVLQQIPTSR